MSHSSESLSTLYQRIQGDRFRIDRPFSDDILKANDLLLNPAAYPDEIQEGLRLWCKDQQPCQFGRMAAKDRRLHFCVLREPAFTDWSDDDIVQEIAESKRLWKQRAAYEPNKGAHSFILVLASLKLAYAAPDAHLRAFADRALELAGWTTETTSRRRRNTICSDYLYLRNPKDNQFYGFQFNVDFFAAAGDQRWWHDHRFPGGIAFTANSTGHMRYYREWYRETDSSAAGEWAVRQAMKTVASAFPTAKFCPNDAAAESPAATPAEEGRVTWLLPLGEEGQTFVPGVPCPLSKVSPDLANKDWTKYEGLLHTDHAVREEFFLDRDVAPTVTNPYLMDLTYLYDTSQADFIEFTAGKVISEALIQGEIGDPSTWSHRHSPFPTPRGSQDDVRVAEQIAACQAWAVPPSYLLLDGDQ